MKTTNRYKARIKHFITPFTQTQKQKQLLIKVPLVMYLNQSIISNIQKSLGQCPGWIIDSVIDHNINISKYNLLAGSSYIKLPKQLDSSRKGLINIQHIDDNEYFNWCLSLQIITKQELQKLTQNFQKDLILKT